MKDTFYETGISDARWIAFDLPGNAGWIAYFICEGLLLRRGVDVFAAIAAIPAALMLVGILELISERVKKLDRVLPRVRLYRGFGALTLGGIAGMFVSAFGLIAGRGRLCGCMLAGAGLCALFAWLLFRTYKPRSSDAQ